MVFVHFFLMTMNQGDLSSANSKNSLVRLVGLYKIHIGGVPVLAQRLMSPTSIHKDMGLTPGLAQGVKNLVLP